MKKLLPALALLAALMAGCGSPTGSKTGTDTAQPAADTATAACPILNKLGINASAIHPLSGKMECRDGDSLVALGDKQVRQLLSEVMHFDLLDPQEGIEGTYYIAGARRLPAGHSLLMFHIEWGDAAGHCLATYDSTGRMTDFVDLGAWNSVMPDDNGVFATDHGTAYRELACLDFDSQKPEFTLKRDYRLSNWTDEDGEMKFTDARWQLLKDYRYSIGNDGRFAALGTDLDKVGDADAGAMLLDEMGDLHYLPASDATRPAKLLAIMQRADVKQLLADPEGKAQYCLQGVMQAAFEQNAQVVLQWLAAHRSATPIIDLLRQIFASGWVKKERMTQELAKMPQGNGRAWLEQLTAQWGPADAVG